MVCCSPLTAKIDNWNTFTSNPTVLDWVENGVKLPFNETPKSFVESNPKLNCQQDKFVTEEIARLVSAGIVEESVNKPYCVSPMHCVPKKTGTFRLIHNLRSLNLSIEDRKFANEGISVVQDLVQPDDLAITLDFVAIICPERFWLSLGRQTFHTSSLYHQKALTSRNELMGVYIRYIYILL
jgi:hypothetical protein